MLKSSLEKQPSSTRSINISVIKPNGLSSLWNWFTTKNKKANLQNLMYDKKFKLKLNAEELNALKRNGIDLNNLQDSAMNKGNKMQKSIFILSKDQADINKSNILNSDILCELMKNKVTSQKSRKYKQSIMSTSSISIKSKNNVVNSNMTYIHSVKSKRSIVKSVTSKVSLNVGLKQSNTLVVPSHGNRNMGMKGFPEALLRANTQKKVFVPIYLGKKRCTKTNRGEKDNDVENKNKNVFKDEPNVIPLLMSKLKTMEEQISDIENTTKKINDAVSQKSILKENTSKVSDKPSKVNNRRLITRKLYPKRSFKKFKQNAVVLPSDTPNSHGSSLNSVKGVHDVTVINSDKDKMKNIIDLLENPEKRLKHHPFTIPSDLSEKTLFKANPEAGCDVILKLFKALSANNDSNNETSTDDCQRFESLKHTNNLISVPEHNIFGGESKFGFSEKPRSISFTNDSQVVVDNTDVSTESIALQKNNILSPPSSNDLNNNENIEGQSPELDNSISLPCDRIVETSENDMKNYKINIKSSEVENCNKNCTKKILSENNLNVIVSKEETEAKIQNIQSVIKKENCKVLKNEESEEKGSNNQSLVGIYIANTGEEMEEIKIHEEQLGRGNMKFRSRITTLHDNFGTKLGENVDLKELKHVLEGQREKQIIMLPIGTDSMNICNICIEQAEDSGNNLLCSDVKKEPKLSITIMVKKNLNDEISHKNDIKINYKDMDKNPFFEVKEDYSSAMVDKDTLSVTKDECPTTNQNKENNVDCNSEKYVPPLKFEVSNTIPGSKPINTFADVSSAIKLLGLNKPSLNCNSDGFGIAGVGYLNHEQRKKLDQKISDSTESKKSQERKHMFVKSFAKSSLDLNTDSKPVRRLSESSLKPLKATLNNLFKQDTQPSDKPSYKSIKDMRKTPFYLKEGLRYRKDVNDIMEAMYTEKDLPSSQIPDYVDKSTLKKDQLHRVPDFNGENRNFFNSSLNNVDLYHANSEKTSTTSSTTDMIKNESKQDFIIVHNKPSSEELENTENKNSSFRSKRSNRCHMTLNQGCVLKDLGDELPFDKYRIGDHQTKQMEINCSKNTDKSILVENDEESRGNVILSSISDETLINKNDRNLNDGLNDESKVKCSRLMNHDCTSLTVPYVAKCPRVLAVETTTNNSNLKERSTQRSRSNVRVNPEGTINVTPRCGLTLGESEVHKCPCVLKLNALNDNKLNKVSIDRLNSTLTSNGMVSVVPNHCSGILNYENDGKVKEGSTEQSNMKVTSQLTSQATPNNGFESQITNPKNYCQQIPAKSTISNEVKRNEDLTDRSNVAKNSTTSSLFTQNTGLVSLQISETPQCCSCILSKANTANSKIVRSQAEILLEKEGTCPGKIDKLSIICNTCVNKSEKLYYNSDANMTDPGHEMNNKQGLSETYLNVPKQNFDKNKVADPSLEPIIKNEMTIEDLKDGKVGIDLQSTSNCKLFFGNDFSEEILEKKPQNEIKHSVEKQQSCLHSCLYIPSEETIYSDICDDITEFCWDTLSDSDITNNNHLDDENTNCYNIEDTNLYSTKDQLKPVFNLIGKEKSPFPKVIHNGTLKHYERILKENYSSKYNDFRGSNRDKSGDNSKTVSNHRDNQLSNAQRNYITKDNKETSKYIFSGCFYDILHPHPADNNKTRCYERGAHQSVKRNSLKPIKTNDVERNDHFDSVYGFRNAPFRGGLCSTANYVVNCLHSVEYDIINRNGNSVIACSSLNSYSSANSKILRDCK